MAGELRDRLLAATAEIIDEQGPLKLRIDDVLERVGCSRSTLYRHVSDKDELVREVILARANAMAAIVAHQIEGIADLPARRFDEAKARVEAYKKSRKQARDSDFPGDRR